MDAGRWEYSARDCIDCSCSKNLGWKMLETGVVFWCPSARLQPVFGKGIGTAPRLRHWRIFGVMRPCYAGMQLVVAKRSWAAKRVAESKEVAQRRSCSEKNWLKEEVAEKRCSPKNKYLREEVAEGRSSSEENWPREKLGREVAQRRAASGKIWLR